MTSPAHALILLVEDDVPARTVAAGILESEGYRVREAGDGVEAREILEREIPELIVSDVRMPRCDGFELLQFVRANPVLGLVPFLLLSGRNEKGDLRMGMSLGADDFLVKPHQPEEFLAAVRLRLERAARTTELNLSHQYFLSRVLPHELRTPLNGIMGCGDLLQAAAAAGESVPAAQAAEYAEMIERSSRRLLRVAENLTLWATLERELRMNQTKPPFVAGKLALVSQSDFVPLLQKCADDYGRAEDLAADLAPARVRVPVDGGALQSVIRQLVDNAFKFSLPGQRVTVTGRIEAERYVFEICDEGRGFPAAAIAGLAVLHQLERQKWEQQGIGIGLSIVSSFARLAGGAFTVKPSSPRGVVARLEIFLASPVAAAGRELNSTSP
jgi:two-component system sensor histidine kinase/response regulator